MEFWRCFYGERYRGIAQADSVPPPSKIEKEISEKFNQRWEIYRVATHELGGLHLIADMRTRYTLRDLYNMLEVLDVHDSMKKIAYDKASLEQNKK